MKKSNIYILFCFLFLAFNFSNAQPPPKTKSNRTIDSLLNVLKVLSSPSPEIRLVKGADTIQINTLNLLSKKYRNIDSFEQALQYSQQAKDGAEKSGFQKGEAIACANIGIIYERKGDYENALVNHFKALKIRNEIGEKRGIASSYNSIGVTYVKQGNYQKAMENYLNCLKIIEELGDKKAAGTIYSNIGNIYFNQNNYEKALENYLTSLKIETEIGDKEGESLTYGNIGAAYQKQGKYNEALNNHLKCLQICEEIEDKQGIAVCYNNIGNLYEEQGDYKKALSNQLKSLEISEAISDIQLIAVIYGNIGNIYLKQEKFEKALHYNHLALNILKDIGFKGGIKDAYSSLANLYQKKGDYKQAFNYHKLYSDIKDTLLNEQSSKQITEMNTKYDSEKKEKNIQILTKDKDLQQAEIGKQKFIRNGSIGGLVFALLLAFILFNRFRVTSKQKKIIESQNFQIVESINYSKKIQDSLLPSIDSMRKAIPDLFLFYEPKAIVSGDFYYFKEFEKYTILACVDCTEHGVPGGFMSTLGSLLLDKIVDDEALSPSEILNKLNNEIIRVLHQQNGGEIQDGMDLSVCLIDRINHKIEFSGARNGIIIVTNEQAKRYKADPLPVGGSYMKKGIAIERNFKTQHIPINANDWIYMYTDGFMEQVGGKDALPMNYTQFENHLLNVSKIENSEEKNKLLQMELDNWRGKHERDDDVLLMGFRVG